MVQAQTVGQVSQVEQHKMQTFVNELEFERVLKQQFIFGNERWRMGHG